MTYKQINKSYKEWKNSILEMSRKEEDGREEELIDRFGLDRLKQLRKSLDHIQNNEFAYATFSKETPLKVTPEELVFLEEEDFRTTKRSMVDFNLNDYNKENNHWLPKWVRLPFQSDAQVKRTLKWLFKTHQKFENLRIIDDETLSFAVIEPGKPLPNPKLEDYHTPREMLFGNMYVEGSKMEWKHKIELSHKVHIEVIKNEKEVTH